jgi:hypothetical protein
MVSPTPTWPILRHLAQQRQHVRSTKPKALKPTLSPNLPPTPPSTAEEPSNQVFVKVHSLSKLYTDDTGCFPVRALLGNQYIMIAFHTNGNLISSSKLSSPRTTAITLWPTMPLYHAWQSKILQLIFKSLAMRPVQLTRKLSPSSGMPSSSLSRLICIAATRQNVPSPHSRTTSLQFWPASIL